MSRSAFIASPTPLSPIFFLLPALSYTRLSSTASFSDSLFGPPLESAFKSKSFDGREHLREQSAFGASECKWMLLKNAFLV